jgi:hypothetical protein
MMDDQFVDSFPKNSAELIKIVLQSWRGELYCDIRVWALKNPAEPGSETATYKKICLHSSLVPSLIKSLMKVNEELELLPKRHDDGNRKKGAEKRL